MKACSIEHARVPSAAAKPPPPYLILVVHGYKFDADETADPPTMRRPPPLSTPWRSASPPSDAAGGRGTPESVARGAHASSIAASNLAANPDPCITNVIATPFSLLRPCI